MVSSELRYEPAYAPGGRRASREGRAGVARESAFSVGCSSVPGSGKNSSTIAGTSSSLSSKFPLARADRATSSSAAASVGCRPSLLVKSAHSNDLTARTQKHNGRRGHPLRAMWSPGGSWPAPEEPHSLQSSPSKVVDAMVLRVEAVVTVLVETVEEYCPEALSTSPLITIRVTVARRGGPKSVPPRQ